MFIHDVGTNRLSLQEGRDPPWTRALRTAGRQQDKKCTWLYGTDCKFGLAKNTPLPFRDQASQSQLRGVDRSGMLDARPDPSNCEAVAVRFQDQLEDLGEAHVGRMRADIIEAAASDMARAELGHNEGSSEEDGSAPADSVGDAAMPPPRAAPFPTQRQYAAKWRRLRQHHERKVEGAFGLTNLVPCPMPELWQDAPHVPFDKLISDESQARLSVCRPHHNIVPAQVVGGSCRYAHNQGDVCFARRGPSQLARTVGFVVGRNDGEHLVRVSPAEVCALHESLSWLRTSGNNPVHRWFGTVFETFLGTCRRLADRVSAVLPVGESAWRIRATPKPTTRPREGTVGETVGDEAWHGHLGCRGRSDDTRGA
jgi:hypothetical protein